MEFNITEPIIKESFSFAETLRKLNKCVNNRNTKLLRLTLDKLNIDYSHFTANGNPTTTPISKSCPVCETPFEVTKSNENKVTCSYKCANTYFATRRRKPKAYRTICFKYHGKKCIVCGETNIVEAHHVDEDKKNNDPKNLVPLCPTHHQYWHSKYRKTIERKIKAYISKWIIQN